MRVYIYIYICGWLQTPLALYMSHNTGSSQSIVLALHLIGFVSTLSHLASLGRRIASRTALASYTKHVSPFPASHGHGKAGLNFKIRKMFLACPTYVRLLRLPAKYWSTSSDSSKTFIATNRGALPGSASQCFASSACLTLCVYTIRKIWWGSEGRLTSNEAWKQIANPSNNVKPRNCRRCQEIRYSKAEGHNH